MFLFQKFSFERHMEVPVLGVESKLQLPIYTTATEMPIGAKSCDLHCSLGKCWILNLLSEPGIEPSLSWTLGWVLILLNQEEISQFRIGFARSCPCGAVVTNSTYAQWGSGFNPWPHSVGSRSSVAVSCSVGHRQCSDLVLLWLWRRPAAAGLIWLLAWELPYATGVALHYFLFLICGQSD